MVAAMDIGKLADAVTSFMSSIAGVLSSLVLLARNQPAPRRLMEWSRPPP